MASIQSKRTKSGKRTYYVVVCYAGRHKWLRAGSLSNARALKKQVESLADSERMEKLGLSPKDRRIDQFLAEYLDHVRLRSAPSTLKRYRAALNTFLAFLKMFHPSVRYLTQITPEIIESYQNHRLESVELKAAADGEKPGNHKQKRLPKPQTVNLEVNVLRSALIWAHDREVIPAVPTRKVRPLKPVPAKRARLLSPEECKRLLKTADRLARRDPRMQVYAQAFRFLLHTGLRSGELCNLTWEDVDLKTGLIRIQPKEGWTPKTYSREFFLNDTCLEMLSEIEPKGGCIFRDQAERRLSSDDLRKVLIKVADAAGIQGLTKVHDLRHTFNSIMQMNGVDPATMGKILGHRDIETTMIYTHQTADHLKKSIGKIAI